MKKQSLLLLVLTFFLALGLAGCSSSGVADTTTTPDAYVAEDGAAALEGSWYRCAAVKADGTAYTDEELAGNLGDIVFQNGTFTEDWPEATYHGSYTYADGVVTITYESDGDVQTLTLTDDGYLTYPYEDEGSAWDGEISTFTRVSPIDGTWGVTAATKADGTAYTDEEVAKEAGTLVFDNGTFSESWDGDVRGGGTFAYTLPSGGIVLTYDEGGGGAALTVEDGGDTIVWRYVNEDADDEDHVYNGEVYYYTLKTAE